MPRLTHVTNVTVNIPLQLAIHRSAIAETAAPIFETPALETGIPGAVTLWAPEGADLQPYQDAMERLAWLAMEQ
jgi:hypothetical protein